MHLGHSDFGDGDIGTPAEEDSALGILFIGATGAAEDPYGQFLLICPD